VKVPFMRSGMEQHFPTRVDIWLAITSTPDVRSPDVSDQSYGPGRLIAWLERIA